MVGALLECVLNWLRFGMKGEEHNLKKTEIFNEKNDFQTIPICYSNKRIILRVSFLPENTMNK